MKTLFRVEVLSRKKEEPVVSYKYGDFTTFSSNFLTKGIPDPLKCE